MDIRSLGFRTDLRILEMTGSEIEDRGTHVVVRTPTNPTFFWGNFLLLKAMPVLGGEREVIGAFHTEFPHAEHVAIVNAFERRDVKAAVRLTIEHLEHVERNLRLDPKETDLAQLLNP